mmetsp:Transcript_33565/g.71564  ORF Transcript_33565/g.71564 Transcript_33565/m.71564 type:complete len:420 (+) Transcript_33565:45-1304(+)
MIAVKANKTLTPRASKNNMRRKPISTVAVAPTSPVAMGKALVLLATSCAALSGHSVPATTRRSCVVARSQRGGGQRLCMMRGDRSHHHGHGESHPSALRYRDGDEDQTVDMRMATQRAVDSAATSGRAKAPAPTATPTAARRKAPQFNVFTFTIPSMPRMAPAETSLEDQQQLVMDEYIEYVERRYTRQHPRQRPAPARRPRVVIDFKIPRKIFLSTLALHRYPLTIKPTKAAEPSPAPVQQREEEDPLNVLGLSSLASERLRQRLNVPRDLRDEHALLASSTHGAVSFLAHCMAGGRPLLVPAANAATSTAAATQAAASKTVAAAQAATKAVAASGGRASPYAALSFPAQFQLMLQTLRRLALAFARTTKIMTSFAKRACSEILSKGGFRNTVQLASIASVAVVLMFKPLFKGALKQG